MTTTAVIVASLPQACIVCGGRGVTHLAHVYQVWGADMEHAVRFPCLHCEWRLPVVHLPMRGDR